ncbi:MAG: hypothetical protein L6R42_009607 [Xanthoria sp. 1 TBL-2021]|nr:MAG: hypothetical protein L6R42_009607 [Xanthoria sp. 1 TBL-2021]
MKILLAGSTGFIGREVLDQCLQHPSITSIVALSRRPLEVKDPKLSVAVTPDFLKYPEDVMRKLEGVAACIWCLGKAWMPNNEQAREVCVDYTMVAVKALTAMHNHAATTSGPNPTASIQKKKFRFVYLSGGAAERDQTKPLWFKQDYRRIRFNNRPHPHPRPPPLPSIYPILTSPFPSPTGRNRSPPPHTRPNARRRLRSAHHAPRDGPGEGAEF